MYNRRYCGKHAGVIELCNYFTCATAVPYCARLHIPPPGPTGRHRAKVAIQKTDFRRRLLAARKIRFYRNGCSENVFSVRPHGRNTTYSGERRIRGVLGPRFVGARRPRSFASPSPHSRSREASRREFLLLAMSHFRRYAVVACIFLNNGIFFMSTVTCESTRITVRTRTQSQCRRNP